MRPRGLYFFVFYFFMVEENKHDGEPAGVHERGRREARKEGCIQDLGYKADERTAATTTTPTTSSSSGSGGAKDVKNKFEKREGRVLGRDIQKARDAAGREQVRQRQDWHGPRALVQAREPRGYCGRAGDALAGRRGWRLAPHTHGVGLAPKKLLEKRGDEDWPKWAADERTPEQGGEREPFRTG